MDKEPKDIKLYFSEALEKKTAKERAAYLDKVCGNDIKLRNKIEALLKAYDESDDVPEAPIISQSTFDISPLTEGPGTKIGRYKLLQLIGEGGFGVVYMAEQAEPIRRKVALKIIKLGMDTKQVIARFEAERQALALMEHPNIARVFDAGATETGRPYFVMELVKGIPITEYCDKNNLDTQQRLDLFIDVCKAVQHAHQKGIIHRDIKPSNVMITLHDGKPVPKIIDFGIAKATQHRLTEKTLFTEYRQFIGTPEYMSPEQAEMSGLGVDTRTDIYSLGVLLYELLTGTTPFEAKQLRSAAYDEIRRIICEDEPPKPSTRLSTLGDALSDVAKHRQVQPGQLCKIVRGDLDWVVMRALEKDRTRRYETASEFAEDIGRHLGDEPVSAGPPSTVYRMKKFVRRHRALVTSVAVVLVVLAVGIVVSTIFAIGQARARAQAEQSREKETVARTRAEQAEEATKEKAEELRRTLYVNSIQLADAKYQEGNINRVRELLESCPEDLRGWEWYRLSHIQNQALMTLQGHLNFVYSAAFSPDGKRIVSGSQDKTVKVWDAESGTEVMTLSGHTKTVYSVAFSPDGKRIVSGSYDKTVKVWDAATGDELRTLRGHEREVGPVSFSPDGRRIVSGSMDSTVKVWDAATGAELMTLRGHEGSVGAQFSPDSRRIVSCSWDSSTVKVWDAKTGAELMTLSGHNDGVVGVAFSPDGTQIVSSSKDKTVKLWDAATGAEVITLRGVTPRLRSASFSPDGKRIVLRGEDNTIKVWEVASGTEILTLHGHGQRVTCAVFAPDGKRIVSSSLDKTVKVWDATIDRELMTLRGGSGFVFSPDGKRIVGSKENTIKLWDAANGVELMTLHGHEEDISSVSFSLDGKRIVSGSYDKTVKVWDASTGTELMTLCGHQVMVYSVGFSPDGRRIVSGGEDQTIKVWDTATGAELMTLRGHDDWVDSVAFSPDGKRIVSSSDDKTIKVWDASTGGEVMTLRGHEGGVPSVDFSPDGNRIVSGSWDNMVKVWDAATGTEILTLRGHGGPVICVAFSPDDKRIVSSGFGTRAKVWDAATGTQLITLPGSGAIAFSPDGKTLAIGNKLFESSAPAGGYEPRKTAEAAREIVDELYEECGFYSEVIEKLKADKALDKPVREVALQIANSRKWEDAEKVNKQGSNSGDPEEVKTQQKAESR